MQTNNIICRITCLFKFYYFFRIFKSSLPCNRRSPRRHQRCFDQRPMVKATRTLPLWSQRMITRLELNVTLRNWVCSKGSHKPRDCQVCVYQVQCYRENKNLFYRKVLKVACLNHEGQNCQHRLGLNMRTPTLILDGEKGASLALVVDSVWVYIQALIHVW